MRLKQKLAHFEADRFQHIGDVMGDVRAFSDAGKIDSGITCLISHLSLSTTPKCAKQTYFYNISLK